MSDVNFNNLRFVRMVGYLNDKPRDTEVEILEGHTDEAIAAVAPTDAYAFVTYYVLRGLINFRGRTYNVTTGRFAESPIRYIGGEVHEDKALFDDSRAGTGTMIYSPGSRLIQTRYGLRRLEPDAVVIQV